MPFALAHVDFERTDEVDNVGVEPTIEGLHNCYRYTIATRTSPSPTRIHGILIYQNISDLLVPEFVAQESSADVIPWVTLDGNVVDQVCEIPGTPLGNARDAQGVVHRLEKIKDSAHVTLVETLLSGNHLRLWVVGTDSSAPMPSLLFLSSHESAKSALQSPNSCVGIPANGDKARIGPYPRKAFARVATADPS